MEARSFVIIKSKTRRAKLRVRVGGTIVMKKPIIIHLYECDISYGEKILWRDLLYLDLYVSMLVQKCLCEQIDKQKEDEAITLDDGFVPW